MNHAAGRGVEANMNIDTIVYFFKRAGIWVYLGFSLIFYFSYHYTESLWGVSLVVISLVAVLLEPLAFLSLWKVKKHRQESIPSLPSGIASFWILAFMAIFFFLARDILDIPVDKIGGDTESLLGRIRSSFLFFYVISYGFSIFYRFMIHLSLGAELLSKISSLDQQKNYLNKAVISILFVILSIILVNYLSWLRNPSIDMSPGYFSFSKDARKVIKSISRPVDLYAFLPELQAVRLSKSRKITPTALYKIAGEVRIALEQLPLINPKIKVHFYNADLESYKSKEFGSVNNGTIVCRSQKNLKGELAASRIDDKPYVERKVYIYSDKDRNYLEKNITKAIVYVASPKKKIYLTEANGERSALKSGQQKGSGISSLKEQLRFYNIEIKSLKKDQSVIAEPIPEDADALLILGASVKFGEENQKVMIDYLKRGGSIFAALETSSSNKKYQEDFAWLRKEMGGDVYDFVNSPLTNTNLKGLTVSSQFENHPSLEGLRTAKNSFIVLPQHGYFAINKDETKKDETKKDKTKKDDEKKNDLSESKGQGETLDKKPSKVQSKNDKKTKKDFSLNEMSPTVFLKSPYNAYPDANWNGRKDGKEATGRYTLGLAYERRKPSSSEDSPKKTSSKKASSKKASSKEEVNPKLVVIPGVEWLTERGLRFPLAHRNFQLVTDILFWMLESPLVASLQAHQRPSRGTQITEKLKWKLLFVGMIAFPLMVSLGLGFGIFYYRRRRRIPSS